MKNRIISTLLLTITIFTGGQQLYGQEDIQIRQKYLTDLKKIIIDQKFQKNTRRVTLQDSTWVEWLNRTGELPPNFSKMKSTPFLPDPLILEEKGKETAIKTITQWNKKREWIKEEYKHWIAGNFPDAPTNLKSEVLLDSVSNNVCIQKIKLSFGPSHAAVLHLELWIPLVKKDLPVFMTQFTHKDWGRLALRRGYAVCLYAASDGADDTEAYQKIYPDYDFSALMRRAWGASRAVDYLYTRSEINKNQIAITGHSRNGKQSLWAAAFDERISAVVSSSSSTGGDGPWRFGDPQYASETLDLVTAANVHWFHPRLRFFFGNEDKLPVDQNSLASLIAPRPLLFHYSVTERGLNAWANEQNYYAAKKVYEFLDAGDQIGVYTRYGEHAVAARDVEFTLDFLDKHFKRNNIAWHNKLYYTYDYEEWLKTHSHIAETAKSKKAIHLKPAYRSIAEFEKDKTEVLKNVHWLLGDEPGGVKPEFIAIAEKSRYDWIESIIGAPTPKNSVTQYYGPYASAGDHLPVRVYFPKNSKGKIDDKKYPAIIYLHQYAHSTGYAKGYNPLGGSSNDALFSELLGAGYAVVAFDLFGFGTRMEEAVNFYERNPSWSKMGKMVADVQGVIDGLEKVNNIDKSKIFVLGNTLGASVGIYSSALDSRIKALASLSGFSPYRSSNNQYESLKAMSHLHGLIPRLGFFSEAPKNTPIDLEEILACIAPRPVLFIAPTLDRYGDDENIERSISATKDVYALFDKANELKLYQPEDINRLSSESLSEIIKFFNNIQ